MNYAKDFNRKETPASQPIPGSNQQPNNGGGFSFVVDDWTRLDRFLVLGAEGGTYYVGERELVKESHDATVRCIKADGVRAVRQIVDISESGRAAKNDPAIFALALVATYGTNGAKQAAFSALDQVCRTGTHLFHFAEYCNKMRGWGRGLRQAIADWYLNKTADKVAYQAVKYRQRDGWTHRDLLRLAHPRTEDTQLNSVFSWIVGKPTGRALPHIVSAFEHAQAATSVAEVVSVIRDSSLPWEAIPTQFLNEPAVWDALLPHMGLTAVIRQLGKLTSIGLIKPFSDASKTIRAKLQNADELKKARIHPIAVLTAQLIYAQGCGFKGKLTWTPDQGIIDDLDKAFYQTFSNVNPSGRRQVLALDVSGSMASAQINGGPLTARAASAAMALVTAATEPETHIVAFSNGLTRLNISPRMRLDTVIAGIDRMSFSATDISLPMRWATQDKINAEGFVVYTDNENNSGPLHPAQALRQFRGAVNPRARLVSVATCATEFTVADPLDSGMLDVVGFDASAPALIADFLRASRC